MQIKEIGKNAYRVDCQQPNLNCLDDQRKSIDNVGYLTSSGVLTYGGFNHDCLARTLLERGYTIEPEEVCGSDDMSLGLRMPDVWYLNKGMAALSIATYYNNIVHQKAFEVPNFVHNLTIAKDFGRRGMVEIYIQDDLEKELNSKNMDYFGTPATITECVRILEGWCLKEYPRLNGYLTFSDLMKTWSQENAPMYDEQGWFLGRKKSKQLLAETGTTNVRDCAKHFWKNYLLKKEPRIESNDVEIDVVDPRFATERSPHTILIGSDISEEVYGVKSPSTDERMVELAQQQYANSQIISLDLRLIKSDGIKTTLDSEVAAITNVLRELI